MRVQYLGLEAFVSIAEYGSFRRAAEVLALSQTALSHRLRKIEDDLGAPLFIRSSQSVSLTPFGQALLPRARHLLTELSETYEAARRNSHKAKMEVRFACVPSVAHTVVPRLLGVFAERWPDVDLKLRDLPVYAIAEQVTGGAVEFGITVAAAHLSDLHVEPLGNESYLLFVPQDSALARRGEATRADLAELPMARIQTQSKNRQLINSALGDQLERIRWRYEVQHGFGALTLVAQGLACSILPQLMLTVAPPGVVGVPFVDVEMTRTLAVIRPRTMPLSEPAADLLERLRQALGERLGPAGRDVG